ncbi:PEP-CTERM sorting domain-containing protein (plasmid) [Verrucomicrobiaceae bacterium 227]
MMKIILTGVAAFGVTGTSQAANILVNSSFEGPVVVGEGNHVGTGPDGWSTDGGFNLVRATGNGALGSDQFVDLTPSAGGAAGTYIFQVFTIATASSVNYGAYFSPRDGTTNGGNASIFDASNTTEISSSPAVAPGPGANSPWELSENTVVLPAGDYVFRSSFADAANTDEAFVDVTAVPEPTSSGLLALSALTLLARRRR